jgi:hypothetical protein
MAVPDGPFASIYDILASLKPRIKGLIRSSTVSYIHLMRQLDVGAFQQADSSDGLHKGLPSLRLQQGQAA